MNFNTLIETIRNAIALASTIKTWAEANYGRVHNTYIGTDPRNSPDSSKYPLIAIYPVSKKTGYDSMERIHDVDIVCGIYDENYTVTGEDNITEYTGIKNIESFRKLIETAVTELTVTELGGRIDALNIIYEPLEFFPYFLAGMTFRVIEDLSQGDDPFM